VQVPCAKGRPSWARLSRRERSWTARNPLRS